MNATSETDVLRQEIEGLSGHKNSRRYPPELRARVLAWAQGRLAEGVSVPAACDEIGIGEPTLRRLLGEPPRRRAVAKRAGFTRVRVVSPAQQDAAGGRLTVRGPHGVVVEGLSVADVAHLFERLSCLA